MTIRNIFIVLILSACCLGCNSRNNKQPEGTKDGIHLPDRTYQAFDEGEGYDYRTDPSRLDTKSFNELQLNRIPRFTDRDPEEQSSYIFLKDTLFKNGKSMIVFIIDRSEGEDCGLLASYDTDGNYVSSLEVFYTDYVEYYRDISGFIRNDTIVVKRIDYDYSDDEEKMDSVIVRYRVEDNLMITGINNPAR